MEVVSRAPVASLSNAPVMSMAKPIRPAIVAGGAAKKPPRAFDTAPAARHGGKRPPALPSSLVCVCSGDEVESFSMATPRGEEAGRHFIGTPTAKGILNAFLDFDDTDLDGGGPPLDFTDDDLSRLVTTGVSACELDCGVSLAGSPALGSPTRSLEAPPPARPRKEASKEPFPSLTSGAPKSRRRQRVCEDKVASSAQEISQELRAALTAMSDEATSHREAHPRTSAQLDAERSLRIAGPKQQNDCCDAEYEDDFEDEDSSDTQSEAESDPESEDDS